MTKDEALKLALEALEYFSDTATLNMDKAFSEDAMNAIKEALAQPEQEPVGFAVMQKPWVGLTDEEIEAAIPFKDLSGEYYYDDVLNIILFIQAKLKRKNAEEN